MVMEKYNKNKLKNKINEILWRSVYCNLPKREALI